MTTIDGSDTAGDRQRILDATITELALTNTDSVTMSAVAQRAGVDVEHIKNIWANTPELLNAAIMSYSGGNIAVPDTGSLRQDMLEYARMFAELVNSPVGRRIMNAVVATSREWDVSGFRDSFFQSRQSRVEPMLLRAVERGECSPDIDAARVMDLLNAGLCMSLQLYNRPVTQADCEFVIDVLTCGILRHS